VKKYKFVTFTQNTKREDDYTPNQILIFFAQNDKILTKLRRERQFLSIKITCNPDPDPNLIFLHQNLT
jgi:hypothetical protein